MASPALSGYFTHLSHGGIVPKKEAMKYEALRLSSFQAYPQHLPQSVAKLSNAGFFFTGIDDEVECFACCLKLKDWGPNDVPLEVHRRYANDCPFINNNKADNIPLASQAQLGYTEEDNLQSPAQVADRFSALSTSDYHSGSGAQSNSSGSRSLSTPQCDAETEGQPLNESGNLTERKSKDIVSRGNDRTTVQPPVSQVPQPRPNPPTSSSLFPQPQVDSRQDHRYERSRLASFQNWPSNAAVRPDDLARSGFYYTGTDDRVQCTFCRGILRNWEPNDVPDAEHKRHFGQCPFLSDPHSVGNVTIGDENSNQGTGYSHEDYSVGIVTERPVHKSHSLPADRLATFKDFPSNMTQSPEMFARAGFFYSGISDNVKCFFCDGGLRNWEPNDDPWTEHARWFPRCGYLRLCKGDEYVKEVQSRYAPPSQHQKPPRMRNRNAHKHPVDQQKVREYMRTAIAKSVLEMGFEADKVKQSIVRRLQDLGDDFFPNAESLIDAISEYEDELKYKEIYGDDDTNEEMNEQENNEAGANDNPDEPKSEKKKNKKKRNKKKKNPSNDETSQNLTHLDADEAKSLAEDVQRLKDERTCKICMDEEVNVVFLRCGHLVCCANCAPSMRHCPICRETIRGTVRVFLS